MKTTQMLTWVKCQNQVTSFSAKDEKETMNMSENKNETEDHDDLTLLQYTITEHGHCCITR